MSACSPHSIIPSYHGIGLGIRRPGSGGFAVVLTLSCELSIVKSTTSRPPAETFPFTGIKAVPDATLFADRLGE